MALVILGLTKCKICGEIIDEDRPFVAFPAVSLSAIETAHRKFNDSVVHVDCFKTAYENWEEITESFRIAAARRT